MEREFQVIRLVGQLTEVPVPEAVWVEPDPAALGTPFYIMSRVDGDVPDDIIAGLFGSPGIPHFMRLEDVATQYERATGHAIRDIDFYLTYTAIQWAIVFVIAGLRRVHFGEQAMPDDVQGSLTLTRPCGAGTGSGRCGSPMRSATTGSTSESARTASR